ADATKRVPSPCPGYPLHAILARRGGWLFSSGERNDHLDIEHLDQTGGGRSTGGARRDDPGRRTPAPRPRRRLPHPRHLRRPRDRRRLPDRPPPALTPACAGPIAGALIPPCRR